VRLPCDIMPRKRPWRRSPWRRSLRSPRPGQLVTNEDSTMIGSIDPAAVQLRRMIWRALLVMSLLAVAAPFSRAKAEGAYPNKPVRVIVPFGPGGVADVTTRLVADKLGEKLGQRFIVENQPGAGGIAAARAAITGGNDGYTIVLLTNGTAISVPLFKSL